jgi:hypothetical protein
VSRGEARCRSVRHGFTQRTALAGIIDDRSKPFINDELITKVRLALAQGASGNVVRLPR